MPTLWYLALALTISMGCGGGTKVISGEKMQITSAPSGAEVKVFELKRFEGSALDQTSLPPSTYQGITPMEISLNLLEANNRGVAFYLIQYKKNGYLPDIKIVKLSSRYKADQSKAKAQKYLMPLMAIAPITIIPVGLAIGNQYYTAISISIESIHAEMEPVNSVTNNASAEIISCIENYLGIAEPRIEYQEKPLFIKFIPAVWYVRWKGEPRDINCQRLMKEMQQGKKIAFMPGILKFLDRTFIFSENSYIDLNEKGEIKCFGVTVEIY